MKEILFNKTLWIFLIFIVGYIILFSLCGYSFLYGIEFYGLNMSTVFGIFILLTASLLIFIKSRFLILLAPILGVIISIFAAPNIDHLINKIRIYYTAKSDLPTYGNLIEWGLSNRITDSSEHYLVKIKNNDDKMVEKFKAKFTPTHRDCMLSTKSIDDSFLLFSIDCF